MKGASKRILISLPYTKYNYQIKVIKNMANRKQTLQLNYKEGYRADIDGLRAIAVLAVIIFHINPVLLPGGFVGVDMFFVISGYLITLHLLRDVFSGNFSFLSFYARRVKRIVPMVILVIVVTLSVSMIFHRPEDTIGVAKSGLFSLLSMANVYFWWFLESSYFSTSSHEMPLLHLWSLAVEEQFYFIWPFVLLLICKLGSFPKTLVLLLVLAALAFVLGEIAYLYSPSFAYYMLPTRAGGLIIGGITAVLLNKDNARTLSQNACLTISSSGVLLLIYSICFISKSDVFPGLNAFFPSIGTALIIYAGAHNISYVNNVLTCRLLVAVGLVSYSAYLWHWPIISFLKYAQIPINFTTGLLIFATTFALAYLSYQYVEKPTRKIKKSSSFIFSSYLVAPSIIVAGFCLLIIKSEGFFMHYKASELREVYQYTKPAFRYDYVCQDWLINEELKNERNCEVGDRDVGNNVKVLLWGDSNAAHYVGVLGAFAKHSEFSFTNLQHSSCPPLLSSPTEFIPPNREASCVESLEYMSKEVMQYDIIIISAAWINYINTTGHFLDDFFSTVDAIRERGGSVIILGHVPHVRGFDRTCLEKSILLNTVECNKETKVEMLSEISNINSDLMRFASKNEDVEYFDIVEFICENGVCSSSDKDGIPLYFDASHLSLSGSWRIGYQIIDTIGDIPPAFAKIKEFENQERDVP
ncbi:acyltransferase family protein [Alteromonas flava]|uniref:acyltransferase family protein n=1 Tax=Alteromonas flava TaxID=2048003 RepID=UPI000C2879FB|nr:acyltransferase family protein [Alteromonas flava]